MSESCRRRFTLSDAMFLVVATTPGMLLIRTCIGLDLFVHYPNPRVVPGTWSVIDLSLAMGCLLPGLAIAVLLLSAGRPHPSWREVIAGPGFVACAVAMVAATFPAIHFAISALVTWKQTPFNFTTPFANFFHEWVHEAGPFIVGAWLALALTGRRRPGASWTDRLGCVVGLGWIVTASIGQLFFIAIMPLILWYRS